MWIHGGLRKVYFLILHFPLLCTLVPSLFKGHWICLMIFLTFFSRTLHNFYFSILFQETLLFNHILIPIKQVTNLFSVSLSTCSLPLRNLPPRLHQHTQRNRETSSSEWSITQSSFSGPRKYVCQEGSLKVRKKKQNRLFLTSFLLTIHQQCLWSLCFARGQGAVGLVNHLAAGLWESLAST